MKRAAWVLLLVAGCGPKAPASGGAAPAATPAPIATIPADELTESERARTAPSATPVPADTPSSSIHVEAVGEDELPDRATLLWKADRPLDVDKSLLLVKEGTLKKVAPPQNTDTATRYYPFAIDYWGITRTDLSPILEKNVGKPVRIKGHYRKIYDDGEWAYEVDPLSIVLLPAPLP